MVSSDQDAPALPELDKVDIIMVMGRTGAGKSAFINAVSNSELAVGDDWESCTKELEFSQTATFKVARDGGKIEERRVVFIDTPGFEDTDRTQAELLELITALLMLLYEGGHLIIGVIYLVDGTTVRMGNSDKTNILMFQNMVGSDAMKNVIVATNKLEPNISNEKEARITGYLKNFFGGLFDEGAGMVHLKEDNSQKIVEEILERNAALPLQIQKEMVDQKKKLFKTAAGSVIDHDLDAKLQKIQKCLGMLNETDEQGQQTNHNGGNANEVDNQSINADHCDRNKRAPREQKTDTYESKRTGATSVTVQIHKYERIEAFLRKDQLILSRNGEEVRASQAGKAANKTVGWLINTTLKDVLLGAKVGTVAGTVAGGVAGGAAIVGGIVAAPVALPVLVVAGVAVAGVAVAGVAVAGVAGGAMGLVTGGVVGGAVGGAIAVTKFISEE